MEDYNLNAKFKNIIRYGLVSAMLIILVVAIAGCTRTVSSSIPSASTSSPTATSAQQRRGVFGTLSTVNGNTLTVSTAQGTQVSVTISSGTVIQKTASGSLTDLQQGVSITVTGTPDTTGDIAATSIVIVAQGQAQGQGTAAVGGFTGRQGQGTSGAISSINGNNLTLTTAQGSQQTVTISGSTSIEKTVVGTSADLQPGESLTIMGTTDANGNTAATLIIINSSGQTQASAPVPSSPASATPAPTTPPTSPTISSVISTNIPSIPAVQPLGLISGSPIVLVTAPVDVSTIPAGDVEIDTMVSNFNLVNNIGQANVAGEGHLIFYMDTTPPYSPNSAATTGPGTFAESTATTYTWHNVGAGYHYFSVQAVNNDDTPLSPAIVVTIYVTVQGTIQTNPGTSSTQ